MPAFLTGEANDAVAGGQEVEIPDACSGRGGDVEQVADRGFFVGGEC